MSRDKRIHIDFETRSIADLRTLGSTIYAQHDSTEPLMLAVVTPEVEGVIDFMNDPRFKGVERKPFPATLQKAIDEDYTFVAHNARFEQDIWYWVCMQRWGWPFPKKWSCTAARARYWGLRASLDGAADDLELPFQKATAEGKEFINTFCVPRKYKGAKKNGNVLISWAEPHEMPEAYAKGIQYCLQDARVEKQIDEMLPDLPEFEQRIWDLDFDINTHGIPMDTEGVAKAIHFSDHYTLAAVQRFNAITGVDPTQRDKVLEYLNGREEMMGLPNLQSKTLGRVNRSNFPPDLQDVIDIRLDCSRASVKKLQAMIDNTSDDGYARGLFMYYGAHTGRWSGKRIQPHNFIRGNGKHADIMFRYLDNPCWSDKAVRANLPAWIDHADTLFPRPLKSLSQSMRGFIKAPDGQYIMSGDYAQIEARVLAWLANCESLLSSFASGEDVYVRFAAEHMYRRKYEDYFDEEGKPTVFPEERQMAKSAVLGAGFQLGGPGFHQYCDNLDIIITDEEADSVIKTYRAAFPEISDYTNGLWARTNFVAIEAVRNEGKVIPLWGTEITYHVERIDEKRWWLICSLPSGRHIAYYRPRADEINQWGKPVLSYRTEWRGGTYREKTYGGKLVENMVQAVARDICAIGALNAAEAGFDIIALIHDEIITLSWFDDENAKLQLKKCLLDVPSWCKGLPLDAEVKSMVRYSK